MDSNVSSVILPCPLDLKSIKAIISIEADDSKTINSLVPVNQNDSDLFDTFLDNKDVRFACKLFMDILMTTLFKELWKCPDAMNPRFESLLKFHKLVKLTVSIYLDQFWKADDLNENLGKTFETLKARYDAEYSVGSYLKHAAKIGLTGLQVVGSLIGFGATIAPTAVIVAVGVQTIGIAGCVDVFAKLVNLGINTFGISLKVAASLIKVVSYIA